MYREFFSHFKAECFYRHTFHEKAEVLRLLKDIWAITITKDFKRLNNLSPIEFGTKAA